MRFGRQFIRGDLSSPSGVRRRISAPDSDVMGRVSESVARFFGTGTFLVSQTIVVVCWIVFNTWGLTSHFDKYPFILLNLAFSTQAAYAAPLILLAQYRQDERDRAQIERDREVAARTQSDTQFLARELASVRLALEDVVTTEDLSERLDRLENVLSDLRDGRPSDSGEGGHATGGAARREPDA